jgi:hypothetical protein
MNNLFFRLLPAAALCLPPFALGQTGRADPAAAKAPAPALRYQSAFADYKPWQDANPGDWRVLNDALRAQAASGAGHAGHAMPGMPAAAAAPAPSASKPATPHGAHHQHGGKQ